ncbi:hypothetical protein HRbin25_00748 [bacterium HR25]|nr:hypothetical protein HRbin25_00748 [bacterium HR25]
MSNSLHLQTTRQEIIRYLQRAGRATVKELGELLGLTATGIRQHLTVLERDGLVTAREERGRVGRPTLVYSLTEKAESLFPKHYDELALALLGELKASEGSERFHQLLKRVAARMAAPHIERVEGRPVEERVAETVRLMEEQGCLAQCSRKGDEFYIDQFTCPYSRVAQEDRAICALHVEMVRQLVGADTRLTRSLLRGEGACTYRIRPLVRAEAG